MSVFVADCPRCGAKQITFDLISNILTSVEYDWQRWYESFCICRHCKKSTVFILSQRNIGDAGKLSNGLVNVDGSVNQYMDVEGYISLRDIVTQEPPEYLPGGIEAAFKEGAACMAIRCYNAAATMFLLCIDLSTKSMLPSDDVDDLNAQIRRNLGLRLPWLFSKNLLPEALRELSLCIKDDGNDGAHEGTLKKEDAEDLLDFTYMLLERIYTEPKRLELAKERRKARRKEQTALNKVPGISTSIQDKGNY